MRYGARKRKFFTSRRTDQLNNSKRSESKTKSPIHYTKNRIETNIRTKKNKQKPIESLDPVHCLILRRWECQSHDQIRKEINTFEIVHKKGHIPIAACTQLGQSQCFSIYNINKSRTSSTRRSCSHRENVDPQQILPLHRQELLL